MQDLEEEESTSRWEAGTGIRSQYLADWEDPVSYIERRGPFAPRGTLFLIPGGQKVSACCV